LCLFKRKSWFGLFFSVLAALCLITGCALENTNVGICKPSSPEPQPNVILITISTLRADHVGCLGCQRDTTPDFDRFAEENILFTNAFATSSWQMPAVGSIFTSLYPTQHGATHINNKLSQKVQTLAGILKENGFYTLGFCCNPRLSADYGFDHGFDFYDDYSVSMMLNSLTFGNEEPIEINTKRTNDLVNDAAIRWLQKNNHRPFFMFMHYYDNHWDYLPPAPYDTLYDPNYVGVIDGIKIVWEPLYSNPPEDRDIEHMIALYDGEVRQTDNDLGEMLSFLKEKHLLDNSIVIIAGDHGEQFYEHGHTSHHGIFEELIHIPLAISIPDKSTKKQKIDSLVSGVDILPTILNFVAVPVPDICEGKSLKPLIESQSEKINDFVFVEYTGGTVPDCLAVRSNRYKYVQENGKSFVYDLLKDPYEQKKIFPENFTNQISRQVRIFQQFLNMRAPND